MRWLSALIVGFLLASLFQLGLFDALGVLFTLVRFAHRTIATLEQPFRCSPGCGL